jgi:nitrogen fixation-related uncharacterized protein
MLATYLTGSLLTLLIPVALLVVVGLYWLWIARSRDEI